MAISNLELSAAMIYSKLYDRSKQVQVQYLQSSYKEYDKLKRFFAEYMKEKKLNSADELPANIQDSYKVMSEMFDLLPLKISKLNASIQS